MLGCGDIYFFIDKHTIMKYYLIHREEQLQVIPVTPDQEIAFLLRYAQQILVSGETLREVLQAFHELPLVICNGL